MNDFHALIELVAEHPGSSVRPLGPDMPPKGATPEQRGAHKMTWGWEVSWQLNDFQIAFQEFRYPIREIKGPFPYPLEEADMRTQSGRLVAADDLRKAGAVRRTEWANPWTYWEHLEAE